MHTILLGVNSVWEGDVCFVNPVLFDRFRGLNQYWGNDRRVFDKRDQALPSDTSAFIFWVETQRSLWRNNEWDKYLVVDFKPVVFHLGLQTKAHWQPWQPPSAAINMWFLVSQRACQSAPPLPSQAFHNANPTAILQAAVKGLRRAFKRLFFALPSFWADVYVTFSPWTGILWWLVVICKQAGLSYLSESGFVMALSRGSIHRRQWCSLIGSVPSFLLSNLSNSELIHSAPTVTCGKTLSLLVLLSTLLLLICPTSQRAFPLPCVYFFPLFVSLLLCRCFQLPELIRPLARSVSASVCLSQQRQRVSPT